MADRLDSDNRLLLQIANAVESAGSGVNPAVQAALDLKEDKANKSTDGTFAAGSDTLYPSQLAAKTFGLAVQTNAHAYTDALTINHSTLTYSTTPSIDFTAAPYRTISLTGNVTFSTANLSAARSVTVRIICDGSIRNLAFPGTWTFVGAAAPATIAASKVGILTITAFGTTDADCVAAYAVQA